MLTRISFWEPSIFDPKDAARRYFFDDYRIFIHVLSDYASNC